VFREPPSRAKFENSVIKELTGGGVFSSRGLYESETQKELNNTMICECNEKPVFSETITPADVRRIIDIYFRSSFKENDDELDVANYVIKANPFYKTKEFQDTHKFALFKILTEYHTKFLNEQKSILLIADSIKLRTNQYLENSCDLVAWFQFEYKQDADNNAEVSYLSLSDLHKHFLESDIYSVLSKRDKDKYTKLKFFEFVKNNLFFKKYYIERYGDRRRLLKSWYKTTEEDI